MQASIDGVNQADVEGEFVEQGDTAESGAIAAFVKFEVNVSTAAKNRPGEIGKFAFIEASLDNSVACVKFLAKAAMALACGGVALTAALALASRGLSV
jgi:hypothetical protein